MNTELQVIPWNEVWPSKTHASSPGHDNSSSSVCLQRRCVPWVERVHPSPPSPLPPLPVTDSLTSLKAHKLWNLWEFPCPYLSFCVSVCPRMSVCPTSAITTVGTAVFPPCWCGTSYIPPLLVWYQLYSPPCWRGSSCISPLLVLYQCTLDFVQTYWPSECSG